MPPVPLALALSSSSRTRCANTGHSYCRSPSCRSPNLSRPQPEPPPCPLGTYQAAVGAFLGCVLVDGVLCECAAVKAPCANYWIFGTTATRKRLGATAGVVAETPPSS
eukprot:12510113-Alexandrium_andersonii.AAC.1